MRRAWMEYACKRKRSSGEEEHEDGGKEKLNRRGVYRLSLTPSHEKRALPQKERRREIKGKESGSFEGRSFRLRLLLTEDSTPIAIKRRKKDPRENEREQRHEAQRKRWAGGDKGGSSCSAGQESMLVQGGAVVRPPKREKSIRKLKRENVYEIGRGKCRCAFR